MNRGRFRKAELKDVETIVSLTGQSLDFSRYCDTKEKCHAFGQGFVLSHLAESNYAIVYEEEEEVLGVLLGTIEKAPLLFESSLGKEAARQYRIAFGENGGSDLYQRACKDMKEKTGLSFQGEITLLSLRPQLRGKGMGRRLVKDYCLKAMEYGDKPIYLYSDTDCNFAFYPHIGFEEMGRRTIFFDLGPEKDGSLTCFLFVADPKKIVAKSI